MTPLAAAAASGQSPSFIAALVELGADPNRRGCSGLGSAVAANRDKALITSRLDTEADLGGCSLHSAAAHGHADIVAALVQSGAELERRSFSGKTAVELAIDRGQWSKTPLSNQ